MRTILENLTNPGATPIEGDVVVYQLGKNGRVTKQYHEPTPDVDDDPTHQEEFTPEELLGAFTTDEAFRAASSTDANVQLQMKVLSYKRDVLISASDSGYQNAINLLYSTGVLTESRRDDLLGGIPL